MKAGRTQRPPRFDGLRASASALSWVPTPPATRSPAIASARAVGSDGSIVRMTPFSRITAASLEVAAYRAATSLVQNMQRRAPAGIELRHSGQSRTVSSTGGSDFARSISAFIGLTTRK